MKQNVDANLLSLLLPCHSQRRSQPLTQGRQDKNISSKISLFSYFSCATPLFNEVKLNDAISTTSAMSTEIVMHLLLQHIKRLRLKNKSNQKQTR